MMNHLLARFLLCLAAMLAFPALAQIDASSGSERILSYDIAVTANANNTLDVTETIRVVAQGIQIRRGLYRDFPTRYKDRYGNNVVVGFDVIDLKRDGQAEPWFTEPMSNGIRVNFGNDDFLKVPATYTYTLRYRTNRQVGFFSDHDELYWNAIGTGWDFPIEHASVSVHLPQPVPVAEMQAEGYTGAQGSKGQDFAASIPEPGVARWALIKPLMPREGLTIVLSFPNGVIAKPSTEQRARWFLHDNRAILIGLGTFLLMFCYLLLSWLRVGRDPEPGIIIARYTPPAGYAPSELRFIRKMNFDDRCFTADLVDMAIKGLIRISNTPKLLDSKEWMLQRADTPLPNDLPNVQRTLYQKLFAIDRLLSVTPENREKLMGAKLVQLKSLNTAYNGRMFKRNGGPAGWAFLIGLIGMIAAFVIANGTGTAVLIVLCFVMLMMLAWFGILMAAPTAEGRKLLDEVDGLKRYLSVAERDDLARMQAPSLDADQFQALLPYAIALDVEDAWSKKFTDAVGAAAAQQATSQMRWYSGSAFSSMNQFTSGLSGSFNASIASASSPPGSSSGGGGGGSSGGGGGGGGGGGR